VNADEEALPMQRAV